MPISTVLLPQSPQSLLQSSTDRLRVLTLKKSLIDMALTALITFSAGDAMHEFDAHVGETLCQIRAYHVLLLKLCPIYNQDRHALDNKISLLQQISHSLRDMITYYKANLYYKEEFQPVHDFFAKNKLVCLLSEFEIYLIQLYLLSYFKMVDEDNDVLIDYKKMCDFLAISKHTARRIIHLYQIDVSHYSVKFIYSLTAKQKNLALNSIFAGLKKIDEDGRQTLPCYWVMRVLYEDMWRQQCPVLVICKRSVKQNPLDTVFILFKPSRFYKNEYDYCLLSTANLYDLCFVLEGVANYDNFDLAPEKTQYIKEFIDHGIKNILFANMAVHPQYSGRRLACYRHEPYLALLKEKLNQKTSSKKERALLQALHHTQQEMVDYAQRIGCGKSNPRFFYIRHIFCDTLNSQVQLASLAEIRDEIHPMPTPLPLIEAVG